MSFSFLGLNQGLLRAVADAGYTSPTPIQVKAIPLVLSGRDLLAAAQTGTGKTGAFVLPVLQRLIDMKKHPTGLVSSPRQCGPFALVLVPTRELAAQVAVAVRTYGRYLSIRSTVVFGGVSIGPQKEQLRRGTDVLIATPGRLLDHVNQKNVDLSEVKMLVLDEADRMLDMGFVRDIRRIIERLPISRQNLLFSATFSSDIRRLAQGLLKNHTTIDVAPHNRPIELVDQCLYSVDNARKKVLLAHLLNMRDWKQVLVFMRTKHGANKLGLYLDKQGVQAAVIHGNKSQGARTKSLGDFKNGRVRVLVATDIAARGIDIVGLPVVVNHDLPQVPEDYVHRVGRTARAGAVGEAISFVCNEERHQLTAITRLIGREIPAFKIAGFEPTQAQAVSRKTGRLAKATSKGSDADHLTRSSGRSGGHSQRTRKSDRARTGESQKTR